MKWKLEYPRFFVAVGDLARHLRRRDVSVCRGSVRFHGVWPLREPAWADHQRLPISASYGANCDEF
jgi:hypothetical protein